MMVEKEPSWVKIVKEVILSQVKESRSAAPRKLKMSPTGPS
jgi:hypothetical protein